MRRTSALVLLLAIAPALFGERWNIQYFYDENHSKLEIVDMAFPTAQRGIAVGWVGDTTSDRKVKPTAVITNDGGAHWTLSPLKEEPRSIFFLNANSGWMVTETGIWFTSEAGLNWRKLCEQPKPDSKLGPATPGGLILRVWFVDEQHGFAVGYQKTVLKTSDGGKTWTHVAEAAKPAGNAAFTAYSTIVFDGNHGFIIGSSVPPRRDLGRFPSWMEPERATKTPAAPTVTLLLETHDQGVTWASSNSSLIGLVTTMKVAGAIGIDVFAYPESFQWPSEVYSLDFSTGMSQSVFREKNRRVFDVALFHGPAAFLAAVEPPGRLNTVPIPGKVKILSSVNLVDWKEMDVDYRASATTLVMAGPDPDHLWVATDTGMILHLVK
ncbi:MAG TPA: YCF48-related protein [Bryobacteraceae bacterium]